jgi:hypothetical protein
MREIENVRQDDPEKIRRWFHDDYFDLFVWQTPTGEFMSFQLCYDVDRNERALVWNAEKGFFHDGVDSGQHAPGEHRTPIFVPDGRFDGDHVIPRFENRAARLDAQVGAFVMQKMRDFYRQPPKDRPARTKVRRDRWQLRRRRKEKWKED